MKNYQRCTQRCCNYFHSRSFAKAKAKRGQRQIIGCILQAEAKLRETERERESVAVIYLQMCETAYGTERAGRDGSQQHSLTVQRQRGTLEESGAGVCAARPRSCGPVSAGSQWSGGNPLWKMEMYYNTVLAASPQSSFSLQYFRGFLQHTCRLVISLIAHSQTLLQGVLFGE